MEVVIDSNKVISAVISKGNVRRFVVLARVVEERVRQVLPLGYYQTLEWLKDILYALWVGLSLLNTPKAYWPEIT